MDEMLREFGRYFLDISKYIATTVLISLIFSDNSDSMFVSLTASVMCIVFLIWGLWCIIKEEERRKK
jgi:hypothetical protein